MNISAVVISNQDVMVGIVTHEDLLRIICDMLRKTEVGHIGSFQRWLYSTPIGDIVFKLAEIGI